MDKETKIEKLFSDISEMKSELNSLKRNNRILSGLSERNLYELDNAMRHYGVEATNKVLSNILRRERKNFETLSFKGFRGFI